MTPYQISSEIYGGFYYPGITLIALVVLSCLFNVPLKRVLCNWLLPHNHIIQLCRHSSPSPIISHSVCIEFLLFCEARLQVNMDWLNYLQYHFDKTISFNCTCSYFSVPMFIQCSFEKSTMQLVITTQSHHTTLQTFISITHHRRSIDWWHQRLAETSQKLDAVFKSHISR